MKGYIDEVKQVLFMFVTIIWASNSTFAILTLLIKVIEFIKSKFKKNKVLPQEKNEKDLVISNLET